jgi:hypothetical protein
VGLVEAALAPVLVAGAPAGPVVGEAAVEAASSASAS